MPGWAIWMIVAAALAGVEVFSLTFLFGPLAVAALLAALVAGLGLGPVFQIAVFACAAIASLAVLRPIAIAHVRTAIPARTAGRSSSGERCGVPAHTTATASSSRGSASQCSRFGAPRRSYLIRR